MSSSLTQFQDFVHTFHLQHFDVQRGNKTLSSVWGVGCLSVSGSVRVCVCACVCACVCKRERGRERESYGYMPTWGSLAAPEICFQLGSLLFLLSVMEPLRLKNTSQRSIKIPVGYCYFSVSCVCVCVCVCVRVCVCVCISDAPGLLCKWLWCKFRMFMLYITFLFLTAVILTATRRM